MERLQMEDRFAALADEFIARVRTANIGPETDVLLVHHCVDQTGVPIDPIRISLVPTTTVRFPGSQEHARQFAAEVHLGTIIDNINANVRHPPPTDPVMLSGGPPFPVTIRDFSLEIVQPTDEPGRTDVAGTIELPLHPDPLPLRVDVGGAVRVGSSRVSLDLVVEQYENGMTPEGIVRAYDTLRLADIYAVIAYYLCHRDEVGAYLKRRAEEAQAQRSKIEADRPRVGRDELLARRSVKEEDHAPAGQ